MLKRSHIFLAAALLIAWAAAFPLLEPNALLNTRGGGDSPFLLQRLHQLMTGLRGGQLPVRWMPDAAYGLGYPFFHYYAPLSIYVAAFFKGIGFPFTRAIQLAQLSGFLTAAWGMFALTRVWFKDDWVALLASVAYTFAPFHFVNVYVRGDSLAEFWAMAFYPLTLYAATKTSQANDWREARLPFLGLAFSFAALVLSHNISALIFSPFLAIYCVLCCVDFESRALHIGNREAFASSSANHAASEDADSSHSGETQRFRITQLMWLVGAGIVGLLLSSWFWLPAIVEKELVQLAPVTEGYFSYVNHFRGWNIVQPNVVFDYSVATDADPFRMGLMQTVLAVVGGCGLLLNWRKFGRYTISFALMLVIVATLMITPLSRPIWNHLPLLDFTQFPWRFLSVQAVGTAMATAGLAMWGRDSLVKRLVVAGAVALLAWSALADLRQVDYLYLTDADVTAERLEEYEWFSGNIGTTISAEYLPEVVQPRSYAGFDEEGFFIAGTGSIVSAEKGNWQIAAESDSTVQLPFLGIDGVRVRVDGSRVDWRVQDGSGWLVLDVPAGEHHVEADYVGTWMTRSAEILSLLTLILTLIPLVNRRSLLIVGSVILVAGSATILVAGGKSDQDGRVPNWDFAQKAYLHNAPDGILFSNGARLGDYSAELTPTHLTITLDWQATGDGTATVALVTPAINRAEPDTPVPTFAEQTLPIAAGQVRYQLSLADNLPSGHYLPRLTLSDGFALTESGELRGDLMFAPLEIVRPPIASDANELTARVDDVARLENGNLLVKMAWTTPQRLPTNYQATWRVYDRFGRFYAELDAQPAYGFSPTTSWQPNVWQHDWVELNWLADDGIEPFSVVMSLRDLATEETIFRQEVGTFVERDGQPQYTAREFQTALPATAVETNARFGGQIELAGYEIEETDDLFLVTLYWKRISAETTPLDDYLRFLYLVNPATGDIEQQVNTAPRFGIAPTSEWRTDDIITDLVALPKPPSPTIEVQVGLFQIVNETYPRLPITVDGKPTGDLLILTRCDQRPCLKSSLLPR